MKKFALVMLLLSGPAAYCDDDPVFHKFQLWGIMDETLKPWFYWGWSNGFLMHRGNGSSGLINCLSKTGHEQAIAMINKYYKDHPERWDRFVADEILVALTVPGSPCEAENPFRTSVSERKHR
jgi:hypothetical protein